MNSKSKNNLNRKSLLILFLIFVATVLIYLTYGAALRQQNLGSKAAVNQATLTLTRGKVDTNSHEVILSAQTNSQIAFAELHLNFDKRSAQLISEINTTNQLSTVNKKSTPSEANSSGTIIISLGLAPADRARAPSGGFEVARFMFRALDNRGGVSIDSAPSYFVDLGANQLGVSGASYNFGNISQPTKVLEQGTTGNKCWNHVINNSGQLFWPNGCKGTTNQTVCTQVIVGLSTQEIIQYNAWLAAGRPIYQGCGISPTAAKTPTKTPTIKPGVQITTTPTLAVSPTMSELPAVPNPPGWWNIIPKNLRDFLNLIYVWVFYFGRPSSFIHLLEGVVPTPTLPVQ